MRCYRRCVMGRSVLLAVAIAGCVVPRSAKRDPPPDPPTSHAQPSATTPQPPESSPPNVAMEAPGSERLEEILAQLDATPMAQRCRAVVPLVLQTDLADAMRGVAQRLQGYSDCRLQTVAVLDDRTVRLRMNDLALPRFQHVDLFFAKRGAAVGIVDIGLPDLGLRASEVIARESVTGPKRKAALARTDLVALTYLTQLADAAWNGATQARLTELSRVYLAYVPDSPVTPTQRSAAMLAAALVDAQRLEVMFAALDATYPHHYRAVTIDGLEHWLTRDWNALQSDLQALARRSHDPAAPFVLYDAYLEKERGNDDAAVAMLETVVDDAEEITPDVALVAVGMGRVDEPLETGSSYLLGVLGFIAPSGSTVLKLEP